MSKIKPKLKIKETLKDFGLSQYELANRMGIETQHVTKMVKPGYNPTFKSLIKIANGIGCKVRDLIDE